MIANQRIADYIRSLEPDLEPGLAEIEKKAREDFVPIIRKETAALLKTMVALKNPEEILEVGTAVGYSALLMAEVLEHGHITTLEKFEKRIPIARENFKKAGKEEQITMLTGDAGELLKSLPDSTYDLVFMDAAKGQYINWLPDVLRVLKDGGLLISDNVLQDGDIVESRFAVERRNRTIHARMREYLYALKHTPQLETAILPIGDGVTLSVKRSKKQEM